MAPSCIDILMNDMTALKYRLCYLQPVYGFVWTPETFLFKSLLASNPPYPTFHAQASVMTEKTYPKPQTPVRIRPGCQFHLNLRFIIH
jgi:hypothetical protein